MKYLIEQKHLPANISLNTIVREIKGHVCVFVQNELTKLIT